MFSKKTVYALRALIALAQLPTDAGCSTMFLAEKSNTPRKFLESILSTLRSAELLISQKGPRGGYRLTRPAQSISLLEIVEAVEGPLVSQICNNPQTCTVCNTPSSCGIRATFGELNQTLRDRLAGISLARLIESEKLLAQKQAGLTHYVI
ncbi:MAG: Rrf2 family transcriptional regulator [Candidatus Margulisiibacteriota bacterium]